jgi:hypothetical protein
MFGKKNKNPDLDKALHETGLDDLPPARAGVILPFFMALLFAALLFGQYLWFFRPALILQNIHARPALELICDLAECSLPPTRDLNRMEVIQRHVDRHSQIEKALLAHILFQNNAFFPQPYPWLELRFHDEHKKTVAVRRFAPEDYLDTPARASHLLPPLQPVHIKLEFFETVKDMHTYGFEIHFL